MLIQLHCEHTNDFKPPPSVGDKVWCHSCKGYSTVTSIDQPIVYRSRCTSCRAARQFGADEGAAYKMARGHLSRNPSHVVRVTVNRELHGVVQNDTPPLPLNNSVGWVAAHPDHQGALKRLIRTHGVNGTEPVVQSGKV